MTTWMNTINMTAGAACYVLGGYNLCKARRLTEAVNAIYVIIIGSFSLTIGIFAEFRYAIKDGEKVPNEVTWLTHEQNTTYLG